MAGRGRVTRFEMGGSSCASTGRICAIWLVMAAVTLVVVPPGHAAGTLDPTFANGATTLPDLRSLSIAVSPDQRIAIAGTGWSGSYAQIKYGAVGVFDSAGSRQATFGGSLPLPPGTNNHSADAVAFDLQGRTLVSGARLSSAGAFTVRLRADGTPSATYANGAPGVMPPSRVGSALALAVDSKGRIVIGGSTASIGGGTTGSSSYTQAAIARLTDDGASDLSFGAGGQVALASGGVVRTLALDRNGGIVFAFGGSAFGSADGETKIMMRLRDDGSFDTAFGNGGQAVIPDAVTVAGDADGRMLAIVRRLGGVEGSYLLRFVDGLPDPTFGVGGAAPLPRAYRTLTAAADGSAFAGITEIAPGQRNILRILRLRPDGSVDTTYGVGGEALATIDLPSPSDGASHPTLAVDGQGRLIGATSLYQGVPYPTSGVLTVTVMLYRFTADTPATPATAPVIEYHHAAFDHYFVSADADEVAKLDADASSGWLRTGESFTVQSRVQGSAMPVCRFFSGATFAPLSSHFYTPYAEECDTVDAGPAWKFEKLAFSLTLPVDAGKGNGTCPPGTVPLYRAYNAMRGGAPNHRYTMRAATLDAMIAQGWIMEGEANTRVFACVPA